MWVNNPLTLISYIYYVYRQKIKKIEKIRKWIKNMQKNVREIAVIMQDKEKEYKICEKLRRQP